MKSNVSKWVCLLLALVLLLSATFSLVSCKDGPEDPKSTSAGTGESDQSGGTGESEDDNPDPLHYLPDTTFEDDNHGKFIILCRDQGNEIFRESSEGDIIDYAIYMRNTEVEERYKITMSYTSIDYWTVPDWVQTVIKAGDTSSVDLVSGQFVFSSNVAVNGDAKNWYEVPHIDLTKKWWSRSNIEDLTMNDQAYLIIGDMLTSTIGLTYCMFYNLNLCERFGINTNDLYKLIAEDGGWTYDYMMTVIQDIREDLNNDNRYTSKDLYGLVTTNGSPMSTYFFAFNMPIFTTDENGDRDCTFFNDKTYNIVKRLVKLYHRTDGCFFFSNQSLADCAEMFADERAVFVNGQFQFAMNQLRDMASEKWMMAPYPKYNERQERYITMTDGGHNALICPNFPGASDRKLEKLGVITEALNCLSNKNVVPVYYERALKSKYINDPRTAEMIDMLMENRLFDFGYCYLAFESPLVWTNDLITNGSDKLANYYASKKDELESKIKKIFLAFGMEYGGLA